MALKSSKKAGRYTTDSKTVKLHPSVLAFFLALGLASIVIMADNALRDIVNGPLDEYEEIIERLSDLTNRTANLQTRSDAVFHNFGILQNTMTALQNSNAAILNRLDEMKDCHENLHADFKSSMDDILKNAIGSLRNSTVSLVRRLDNLHEAQNSIRNEIRRMMTKIGSDLTASLFTSSFELGLSSTNLMITAFTIGSLTGLMYFARKKFRERQAAMLEMHPIPQPRNLENLLALDEARLEGHQIMNLHDISSEDDDDNDQVVDPRIQ